MESQRVDSQVFDMASEAAQQFNLAANETLLQASTAVQQAELEKLLRENQFVGGQIYSPAGVLTLEVWMLPSQELGRLRSTHLGAFPAQGEHHHEALRVGTRIFVRALVPLVDRNRQTSAYFVGVYRVPNATAQAIERRIRETLVEVLVVLALAALALYPVIVALHRSANRLSQDLLTSNIDLMRVLGSAIAKRDSDTDLHNYRVTLYAVRLAESMGRSRAQIAALIAGAFLHDVGKIGISDTILLKPGKLTQEEFAVMATHVTIGEEILHGAKWLEHASEVVRSHHEKLNGSGYPEGLRGDAIPFDARLFAVVDVFDALTSKRPYKDPLPCAEALSALEQGKHSHFDAQMVDHFVKIAPTLWAEFLQSPRAHLDEQLSAIVAHYYRIET